MASGISAIDFRELLQSAGPPGGSIASPALKATSPARLEPVARTKPPLSSTVLSDSVRAVEFVLITTLSLVARDLQGHGIGALDFIRSVLIAILAVGMLRVCRAYQMATLKSIWRTATKMFITWSLSILLIGCAVKLAKLDSAEVSAWLTTLYLFGIGSLLPGRLILLAFVRAKIAQGAFTRRTAIVGGGAASEALIEALEASNDGDIQIIGVFDDRNDNRSAESVAGYPKLGNVSDLVDYARRERIDLIVFTMPITAEARILQMLAKLWVLPIDIRLSAQGTKLRLRPRAYSYLGKVPVLDLFDRPLADWDLIFKSLFDRAVALAAIICLSPVFLAVAIAVRVTSRGPVLFRQKRYGFNNELIEVYKFRSMYVDQSDARASKLVTKDDPRVTPVGRIIRKASLDELPQLFNVLAGSLSLVGPRPHALEAKAANTLYDEVVDGYFARHKVKPGITGWAQINGWRGETDTWEKIQRRVDCDLEYIENWSLTLDIKILALTPFALLNTKNAY
jgi:Undecaprenyl-phosphate glucose phosphotransferase